MLLLCTKKNHAELAKAEAEILKFSELKIEKAVEQFSRISAFAPTTLCEPSLVLSIMQKHPENYVILESLCSFAKDATIFGLLKQHLQGLVAQNQNNGFAHTLLGKILWKEGKSLEEYVKHFYFGLRDPRSQNLAHVCLLYPLLLQAKGSKKKLGAYLFDINRLRRSLPNQEEVQLTIGEAYARLQQVDVARDVLEPIIREGADSEISWKANLIFGKFLPWAWKREKKQCLKTAVNQSRDDKFSRTNYVNAVVIAAMEYFAGGDYNTGMFFMESVSTEKSREVHFYMLRELLHKNQASIETVVQKTVRYCDFYENEKTKTAQEISMIEVLAKRLLLAPQEDTFNLVKRLTRSYTEIPNLFDYFVVASLVEDDSSSVTAEQCKKTTGIGKFIDLLLSANEFIREEKWEEFHGVLGEFTLLGLQNRLYAGFVNKVKNKLLGRVSAL